MSRFSKSKVSPLKNKNQKKKKNAKMKFSVMAKIIIGILHLKKLSSCFRFKLIKEKHFEVLNDVSSDY